MLSDFLKWLFAIASNVAPLRHTKSYFLMFCFFCVSFGVIMLVTLYVYYNDTDLPRRIVVLHAIALAAGFLINFVLKGQAVRRALFRLTGLKIFSAATKEKYAEILSETYQEENKKYQLTATVIILCASLAGVWLDDYSVVVLSFAAICILLFHVAITSFRVSRGYFGTNSAEALELIRFIKNRYQTNDPTPPHSKVGLTEKEEEALSWNTSFGVNKIS